jgi:hypothetical protein
MQISLNTLLQVAAPSSGLEANTVQELISFLQSNEYILQSTLTSAQLTVAGFSDVTSITAQYSITGKMAVVYIPAINGTSNQNFFHLSNIPPTLLSTLQRQQFFTLTVDNALNVRGEVLCPKNGTALDKRFTFEIDGDSSGFTATGSKGTPAAICLTYLL